MPHGTYTAGDQAAHALVRCEYSGAAAMAEYSDTQFGQVPRCTKMEQAGQCATSHLCGRRYERHAGSLVTGNYQEDGLPAPGTPCMGGCVAEAGVWGPNRCWTSAEQNGTAWGAPCYEAPSQSAAEQFALCEEFEMPMYGVKCKTHCSCDAGCQKRGDCCLSDDAMAKACAPPAIEEVCSSVRTHACKRQLNHDYRIIEDAFITVYCLRRFVSPLLLSLIAVTVTKSETPLFIVRELRLSLIRTRTASCGVGLLAGQVY